MAEINTRDNLNQGLPAHGTGLDDDAKEALRRQLEGKNEGIAVGSFADLQRGTVGPPIEGPFNDNVGDTSGLATIPEIAANAADASAPGGDSDDSKKSKK